MSNFWDILWTTFLIFAFLAYLMVLFSIVTDLFRDRSLNGGFKALWIFFLVIAPYVTAFIYLISRGSGMAERQSELHERHRQAAGHYVRDVAGTGVAGEIAHAKQLLDEGILTAEEFATLKAKALAR